MRKGLTRSKSLTVCDNYLGKGKKRQLNTHFFVVK